MNYLGHLYFSNNDTELMYYNLLGDFVKGSNFENLNDKEIYGIKLHRQIDKFIDSHDSVLELMHELYASLPKIAGIAVDLYFDHLLAKNWKTYHTTDLNKFISTFYKNPVDISRYGNPMFEMVLSRMRQYDWLSNYQYREGLDRACKGLSNRISFKNELGNALNVYDKYEKKIECAFVQFMKDAVPYFEQYHKNNYGKIGPLVDN